jgi:uncharacterized protein involved in exopolysaccharide biosynthesis
MSLYTSSVQANQTAQPLTQEEPMSPIFPVASSPATAENPLNAMLQKVWHRKPLVFAVAAFVAGLFIAYGLFIHQPSYTANSKVIVKNSALTSKFVTGEASEVTSSSFTNPILNTVALIESDEVTERLWQYFSKEHPEVLQAKGIKTRQGWGEFFNNGKGLVSAKAMPGTDFISVSFKWKNPVIAKEGLDNVLTAFQDASRNANAQEHKARYGFLKDQIVEVQQRLSTVRDEISQFKTEHDILDVTQENQDYSQSRIALQTELNTVRAEASAKNSEMRRYQSMLGMNAEQASSASALGSNDNLTRLYENLYNVNQEIEKYRDRYTEEHPVMVDAMARKKQMEADIAKEVKRTFGNNTAAPKNAAALKNYSEKVGLIMDGPRADLVTSLLNSKAGLDSASTRAAVMNRQLSQLNSKLSRFPQLKKQLATLEDKEFTLSDTLKSLQAKAMDENLKDLQTLSNIFIVVQPQLPSSASFPNKNHVMVLGLLLGLASGVAAGVLLPFNENTARREATKKPSLFTVAEADETPAPEEVYTSSNAYYQQNRSYVPPTAQELAEEEAAYRAAQATQAVAPSVTQSASSYSPEQSLNGALRRASKGNGLAFL